jgi:transposase
MENTAPKQKTYEDLEQEIGALRVENNGLKQDLANLSNFCLQLKKQIFGRRSEKSSVVYPEMLTLFDLPKPEEKEADEIEIAAHKRNKFHPRKPLPNDLPREQIIHEPEEKTCSCCGAELVKIGEEKSEEIDYIPAKTIIREHIRIKKACPQCKGEVRIAELPSEFKPLERSRPGVGLITHIAISKFCDHLPLNRQEQMFARVGLEIPRQRMWDWLDKTAELLKPIYQALKKEILKHPYLQGDETTIKVQTSEEKGKLHTGYYWAIHSPPNLIYYHYAPSRAAEVPLELFDKFEGYLQTDLYSGYNEVFLPKTVLRLGCMAHARRKLIDAGAANHSGANELLKIIAKLYKIEKLIKKEAPEKRLATRQSESKKLLGELFETADSLQLSLLPKHPLHGAIEYMRKQKVELMRYIDNQDFQIDNNPVERQMRPIAVGRKNYLFTGSHRGAEVAAIFYSLINTCKLNKVNPYDYLSDVLRRIQDHSIQRLDELLPHNWTPKPS